MSTNQRKIGAGHAQAWLRAGFKELAQILPAFPTHGIQPVEEAGLAGNLTPAEVTHQKGTLHDRLGELRAAASPPDQARDAAER